MIENTENEGCFDVGVGKDYSIVQIKPSNIPFYWVIGKVDYRHLYDAPFRIFNTKIHRGKWDHRINQFVQIFKKGENRMIDLYYQKRIKKPWQSFSL